ncbi:APC family permease [Mycolicibacterium mageritense]|uniref:APC family permease n=1 Tax=Mycolicibacterium mageritense TaxID=53462 RepID=UPI0011D414FB|nr:amino acid permease [Mycolicibacterium mageritense]TXI65894.1 MAG: amino acid permease [Mycolicibacterium mageritense]
MSTSSPEDDVQHLQALGYQSEFKRDMSPWANFSLGFTYLSPVVGVYTLFAYALATGGPPMIWSFLIVGVGQLLVALTFSEIVAQFPVAGGVYPWARRLWGRRYAWMTGWVYLVALLVTIASVVYGAGPFIAAAFGFDATVNNTIAFALALLALATAINFMGTKVLAKAAIIGFTAEIIGALVVGVWLLVAHRHHNLGVLFDSFGAGGDGNYMWAFAAAALIGVYQYYGFEACGDVAEEVPDPGRLIPKAMRRTIYIGGAAATFVCLALVLSVADIPAVIGGDDTDPVSTVLGEAFGPIGAKVILLVVLISFLSCAMSLQAAASRLAYSYGRDGMIMGSALLKKFSATRHVPPYALVLAAIVPAVIVIGSKVSTDAITKIISFAAFGIYLGFQMVVLAALRARLKGWVPSGKYQLGSWGLAVNIAALVYGVTAMINMAWPRTPDAPWYDNWIVALSAAVVVGIGLVYMVIHPLHDRSTAPYGDAIPAPRGPGKASATPLSRL